VEFRFRAMRQAHDPNGLDTTVNLASPRSWIALWVTLFVIVGAIVWGFVGTIPSSVPGSGVLTRLDGVVRVQAGTSGVVSAAPVRAQSEVVAGAPLATVTDQFGRPHVLTAPVAGTVLEADYPAGTAVAATDEIVVLARSGEADELIAAVVIPQAPAAQVYVGMPVTLSVDVVPAAQFGLLRGTVVAVDPMPVSERRLASLVLDEATADRLLAGGAMTLVQIGLVDDPATASGYAWTSVAGPPYPLQFQSEVTAEVQLPDQVPIAYLLGGPA